MKTQVILMTAAFWGWSHLAAHCQKTNAKQEQDRQAINAMCGCYEVTFEFGETFAPDTNYHFHENHTSHGLEWVFPLQNEAKKVVLQHLLIVNDSTIIKHWRQDWLYENTELYSYDNDNHWKFMKLSQDKVKGQWTQKVFQVDDSPRYEGSATWVHYDERHYWESTADAPLPRREFTTRQDYNMLKRRNRHEIMPYGWQHEQDNDKFLRSGNGNLLIASEKGWNTYKKTDNIRCQPAVSWWEANKNYWEKVRTEWAAIFARQQDLVLEKKVDDKPLFIYLFAQKTDASTEEIKVILNKFVKD